MQQVNILLRDLCDLHKVPLPNELNTLLSPPNGESANATVHQRNEIITIEDSDDENDEEIDDVSFEWEPDNEIDEELSMEIEAVRNAKKV